MSQIPQALGERVPTLYSRDCEFSAYQAKSPNSSAEFPLDQSPGWPQRLAYSHSISVGNRIVSPVDSDAQRQNAVASL